MSILIVIQDQDGLKRSAEQSAEWRPDFLVDAPLVTVLKIISVSTATFPDALASAVSFLATVYVPITATQIGKP